MDHVPAIGGDTADSVPQPRRLETWKEIAAYFRRDARTVRRWEQAEGMPVHRHLHHARDSVYAFPDELDSWWEARSARRVTLADGRPRRARRWLLGSCAIVSGLLVVLFVVKRAAVEPVRPPSGAPSTISGSGHTRPLPVPDDPDVRDAFLFARHHLTRRNGQLQKALGYLEQVTTRAPGFAGGHALLGESYLRVGLYDPTARADAWSRGEAAARRAIELDEGLAAGHAVLGRVLLLRDWDWASAQAEIARAVELDAEDPEVRSTRAFYLRSAGRLTDALAERLRAQQADPANPQWLVFLGAEHAFLRQYGEAIRSYERALELERDHRGAVGGMADVLERTGRHAEGQRWQLRYLRMIGRDDLAAGYDEASQRDGAVAARQWLDRQQLLEYKRKPDGHHWDLAYLHARLGNRELAFQELKLALERREPGLLQARVDPDVDPLRGDARFGFLLEQIGPPH
jgi:tetratricopeptide (TPR) repeat protein